MAPGAAAVFAAFSAWAFACRACVARSVAAVLFRSVMMSATTCPDAALEVDIAWQAAPVVLHVPVVWFWLLGGPREPSPPLRWLVPVMPVAVLCGLPLHAVFPSQSRLAQAVVQLDAPGTVGPPVTADEPGAVGWFGSWPGRLSSPLEAVWPPLPPIAVLLVTALLVGWSWTIGLMLLASGLLDEAPLITATQRPPVVPAQEPSALLPLASAETPGFVASTTPVSRPPPVPVSLPPMVVAADGPVPSRLRFTSSPA
ncbi:hypothetical protein GCM10023321_70250 [Pseudonocardia eucalypti]|uniref:Uncharacterized protein n=1 Tax=Pseudonocardia eucalypti TaxID=648755 RepID=A0ABP9R4H7_9PSEU